MSTGTIRFLVASLDMWARTEDNYTFAFLSKFAVKVAQFFFDQWRIKSPSRRAPSGSFAVWIEDAFLQSSTILLDSSLRSKKPGRMSADQARKLAISGESLLS